jgi:hypothetical protein
VTPEEIAHRFDNRSGYRLVTYGLVGLPIFRITAIAFCLGRKELAPIDEFILRGLAAGLRSMREVAGLLGLEPVVVEASLTELIRSECVRASQVPDGEVAIELTTKGVHLAREQEIVVPMEQTIVFTIDGLTRKPRLYPAENLYKPRELRDAGLPEVRAFPSRAPELEEIDLKDVIDVVRLDNGRVDSPRQLLRVNSLERRDRLYLEAIALAYRAETGGTLQAGFAIDGRLSVEHEQAFARARGIEKTKLFGGLLDRQAPQPAMARVLGEQMAHRLEVAAKGVKDAERLQQEARSARSRIAPGAQQKAESGDDAARRELAAVDAKLAALVVRPLAVYEHPPLLRRSLMEAERRVLIVSPWIRSGVVNASFMKHLRQCLGRGVTVLIGYGLGEDDGEEMEWDRKCRQELEALSRQSKLLSFRRLGDTHAKILIKDSEFFVITSFNWLSFRGDPNQTFREEWGTYVGVPEMVDEYFERMSVRFSASEPARVP